MQSVLKEISKIASMLRETQDISLGLACYLAYHYMTIEPQKGCHSQKFISVDFIEFCEFLRGTGVE